MKRQSPRGFTLLEMIVVIAVIIVLAGLVIYIAPLVNQKQARARAAAEMKVMTTQLDSYNVDNGTYPRTADTDALDPRVDVNSTSQRYLLANLAMYSAITGDYQPAGGPDGKPESDSKRYGTFSPSQLNFAKDNGGNPAAIRYVSDPWGNAYGYSTAAAKMEESYKAEARKDPKAARPTNLEGYTPPFDLWSTAGATTPAQTSKWVRN